MSVATAIPGASPFESPFDVLRGLLDRARASLERLADGRARAEREIFEQRMHALEDLLTSMNTEVVQAFVAARPEDVDRITVDVGRRHWGLWGSAIELAREIGKQMGVDAGPSVKQLDLFNDLALNAHLLMPMLPIEARRFVRAFGFLLRHIDIVEAQRVGETALSMPAEEFPDEVVCLATLLHGLRLGGTSGSIHPEVLTAMAESLWRCALGPAITDEMVDEAWDAASALEATLDPSSSEEWAAAKSHLGI